MCCDDTDYGVSGEEYELPDLSRFTQLTSLDLTAWNLSDLCSLSPLCSLTNLVELRLRTLSYITYRESKQLAEALPHLRVFAAYTSDEDVALPTAVLSRSPCIRSAFLDCCGMLYCWPKRDWVPAASLEEVEFGGGYDGAAVRELAARAPGVRIRHCARELADDPSPQLRYVGRRPQLPYVVIAQDGDGEVSEPDESGTEPSLMTDTEDESDSDFSADDAD